MKVVLRFPEGYHPGDRLFGPCAAIWLTRLREGAKDGTLSADDRAAHSALKAH